MAADSLQKTAKAAALPGHRRRLRAVGEKPPAVVIAGPTASGKSALALALAEALRGTIVNADSQQLYRDLPILSARPDAAAEALAPHRLDAAERSRVPSARQTLAATAEMDLSHLAGTDQRCMLRYPVTMSGNHGLIRRAIPTRFDRRAEAGRNSPLLVAVETSDGIEHEVFLKASGQPELGVEGLANEAVAACLAGDLSLPINEPFLVELDPEWVASIPDTGTRSILEMSAGVAFGSKSAGEQWRIWSAADRISTGRRAHALAIFAFDAYIENDDRRSSNPNCLVKGEAFRIIDHETAFRIRLKLSPRPAPWKLGNLQRVVGPDGHLFASGLKGRDLDFAAIRAAWCGISDTRLQRYLTALPEEWFEANPAMQDAVTHLRNVRERIDDCLAELRRVLA